MRYAFIQGHHAVFRVTRMCRALQVSRSGFYAWQRRAESPRAQANRALLEHMRRVHQQTR